MESKEIILDTPIEEIPFTVIDTETTGTDPGQDHEMIEVGMVHYRGRKVTDRFETLIRPTRFLTREAARTHKIPVEELKRAPRFSAIADDIVGFIGETVIAAHNVNFDMTFLHSSLRRLGRPVIDNWSIDTILLSQRTWPELTCHCLICLGSSLKLPHSGTHRALEDVYATVELLDRIIGELKKRGGRTLGDLHPFRRDYSWKEGDVYRELERNLLCAIRRRRLVHLYLYDKGECLYYRQTVEPLEITDDGNLAARKLGEERLRKFPLYNIMKVSPTYRE